MPENVQASRMVKRARTSLLTGKPAGRGGFFGALAMRLDVVEDPKLKELMATNGRVLKFNPEMVMKTSPELMLSGVAHEVLHCASLHHIRRGNRDVKLYNVACDYAVNLELKDAGFQIPDDAYIDERFRGMSVERIFSILESEMPPGGGKGEGEGDGGQSGQRQRGKGKGQGQGESSPQWSGGVEDMPKERQEQDDGEGDGDGDSDGNDGEGSGPSEAEKQAEQREWELATVQAANAAQQMGNAPAFAERFVHDIMKPKIDPWQVLREYVKEVAQSDYRWFPPNRRFVSQGLYLPSMRSDDALGEITVCIDTSGSIDAKTLQEFCNHIAAIKEDFNPKLVRVMFCDAMVNHVDVYERDQPFPAQLKMHGGGGTDFRPPFKWLAKRPDTDTQVFVYLTDGYGTFTEKAPPFPVIWAMTTEVTAPWGKTIRISV